MLTEEQIVENWDNFRKFASKVTSRSVELNAMLDHFEKRASLAPASGKKDYHAAYPGGLVDHSLRVLFCAKKLLTVYKAASEDVAINDESLILAALFHDWGKVGDLNEDLYVPQESDWHREKLGEMYTINKKLTYMPNQHRTLWHFQHFGIKLSEDEFLAILLNDGPIDEGNKRYCMKEPTLAVIIQQADRMACELEKKFN